MLVRAINLMSCLTVLVGCVAFRGGKAGTKEGSSASTQRQEVPELLYRKELPDLQQKTRPMITVHRGMAVDSYGQWELFYVR